MSSSNERTGPHPIVDLSPSLTEGVDEPSTDEILRALEAGGVGIALLDVDARVVYSNLELLRGQGIRRVLSTGCWKRFRASCERTILESRHESLEISLDAHGEPHWYDCGLTPWLRGDEVVGVLMVVRSVHEDRRARVGLAQFRALLDVAEEMILVACAESGDILDVSAAVTRMLGYDRDAIATTKMWMLDGEAGLDASRWSVELDRLRAVGGRGHRRTEMRRADGELLEVEVSTVLHELEGRTYALYLVRDITRQIGTEKRLEAAESRLKQIAAAIPGVVYQTILGRDGGMRLSYVSESARQFFGFDPDALIGLDPTLLMSPASKERLERVTLTAAEHSLFVDETLELNTPKGQTITVRASSKPSRLPNGDTEFNGVLLDVSERTRLESRMHEMQKLEAVGRIAGTVAHDFNNALTAILSCTAIAARTLGEDSPVRQELDLINTAAGRAAEMTRQLLTFARQQESEPALVDVSELVAELQPMLARVIGEVHRFEVELAGKLPATRIDPGQLERVVVNLVVNARDAMPGPGRILVSTGRRDIDESMVLDAPALQPGGYVAITVADTGEGMSRDVASQIFEPFFTTKETGTGLGLASSYGIVRQAGGHIEVDSEPGQGARFHVLLPAQEVAADGRASGKMPALRRGGNESVLLVEDDPILRKVIARTLGGLGYEIRVAASGTEAAEILESEATEIDLVLTDMVLPGLGGAELARRALERCQSVRVLFVSGYGDLELADELRSTGRVSFLPKPFSSPELASRVRDVLDGE